MAQHALKVTVIIERDGERMDGFPLVRRYAVDYISTFSEVRATDAGVYVPATELGNPVSALFFSPAVLMNLRLNGQSTANIPVSAGGFLLGMGLNLTSGPTTALTVSNPTSSALIEGFGAGT